MESAINNAAADSMVTVACVQLNSGDHVADNLDYAESLIRKAAKSGARLITLPENAFLIEENGEKFYAAAQPFNQHSALKRAQNWAAEHAIWLLIGSLAVHLPGEKRLANRSVLLSPSGQVHAWYDKVHMFDAVLNNGETYRESNRFTPGDAAVLAQTSWAKIGMSICYDLRFPHLFRMLAQAGAQMITVPSAFTLHTGEAHWHTLLRARAIENCCYILAPAQCGQHPGNRRTFGHSLIVDPWGHVLAEAGTGPGVILADIDLARVRELRESMPSLQHDREFLLRQFT